MTQEILRRLHRRDGGRCGAHIGECNESVRLEDAVVDHIIPEAYFQSEFRRKFNNDWYGEWNLQVRHHDCQKQIDLKQVAANLRCRCHFVYIDIEADELNVYYRDSSKTWQFYTVASHVIRGSTAELFAMPLSQPSCSEYNAYRINLSEMCRVQPGWPLVVRSIVSEAVAQEKLALERDGYFRFNAHIAPNPDAPMLTFQLQLAEADLLFRKAIWLAGSGMFDPCTTGGEMVKRIQLPDDPRLVRWIPITPEDDNE